MDNNLDSRGRIKITKKELDELYEVTDQVLPTTEVHEIVKDEEDRFKKYTEDVDEKELQEFIDGS